MKPLPLPIRLAAGLAVSAKERARDLPRQLTGLPITVASQMLQLSMRLQQQVTELAIKGDDALSGLRPIEETPSWATFDEDLDESAAEMDDAEFDPAVPEVTVPAPRTQVNGSSSVSALRTSKFDAAPEDPWAEEEQALAEQDREAEADDEPDASGPEWLPNYDTLSLPQLRARLRRFTPDQLAELLSYERATANRPSFSGMLRRRIDTVARQDSERDDKSS
ncbi:MAG: lipid droplet-associated protein [Actinophytocola sp.]|nr:lipid droplet-associated protein [Actinophytocola sp.]